MSAEPGLMTNPEFLALCARIAAENPDLDPKAMSIKIQDAWEYQRIQDKRKAQRAYLDRRERF